MSEANKRAYTRTEGEYEELERKLEKTQRLLELEKQWTKSTQGVMTTFATALSKRNNQLEEAFSLKAQLRIISESRSVIHQCLGILKVEQYPTKPCIIDVAQEIGYLEGIFKKGQLKEKGEDE